MKSKDKLILAKILKYIEEILTTELNELEEQLKEII